ncbi:unnamed protein product [Medioppia subpectinata]|uniref:Short-chain dehydrogenase/reductase 3 n=1 Tax=Medioppia subpectinata TaxID=1979941 RepID=A0A7R9KTA0_9ACAR|nr:unnamed protein product [Medioppia subpectinata]CAG2109440.1 unnamed protein product [Medioppia subpectinata]
MSVHTIVEICILLYNILSAYIECLINIFRNVPKKDIRDHVVVITGAGHGLGAEIAKLFAKLGARLALIDINKTNNERIVEEIKDITGSKHVFGYCCDITNEEAVAQVVQQIQRDLGDVDILINNAGIVQCLPFESLSTKNIKKTFEVNTFAHFYLIGHYLPKMVSRGVGHIVAISSIAGLIGTAHLVDYCASKFAIIGLMEALEMELRQNEINDGIKLTTICPLAMTTGMFKKPRSRFNWIFPVIDAKYVAKETVNAILRNQTLITVPKNALYFYGLGKIVPLKAKLAMQQFFSYGVDAHQ